ncbi:MAG: restriction endonuclease subunit S [Nitrospirae bacterium]|nr:restriction endonuclease subunit S [Nitrospirota bacterium]
MSWRTAHLGDVLTLKRGHDLPDSQRQDGDVPVVSSSGITGQHNESKARAPGVVTGRYGTLGDVFYIEQDYWPLNTALYVVDFKGNHPRFAAYFLQNVLRDYQSDKAAVPGVNRNVLHELKVRCPDTTLQAHIADILSAYDDLIENNRRRMALLEEVARQLYREWFVRLRFPRLRQGYGGQAGHEHARINNGVPEGWERTRIGDVADCVGGGTPPTSVSNYWEDGEVTWVTPTDVTRNAHFVLLDSEKKITEAGLQNSSAKLVPPHAVLMTSRASVGFFAVVGRAACTNQGFISIVSHDPILWPYFLFHLSERVEEIRAMGSGSTYPEVSRGKFRELEVLLPKHSLATAFCDQAMVLLSQIRILKQQNDKLRAARDLLLPRLMSGELAV